MRMRIMNENHPVEVRSPEASNESKAVNSIGERGSNPIPRTTMLKTAGGSSGRCCQHFLFLHDRGEVRYADLTKLIASRGTLSLCLKELGEEKLVQRRIETSKPIQAHYSLTSRGREIVTHLYKIEETL
jgi:hypothetical protein